MRTATSLIALGLLVGCGSGGGGADGATKREGRQGARAEVASHPAPRSEGERLFNANCAVCHSEGKLYPGYVHLEQSGAAQPALSRRDDLDPDYIKQVVRVGMGAMPAFTPTHVSDAELDQIALWLARKKT